MSASVDVLLQRHGGRIKVQIISAPPPDVGALMCGRPVAEVAEIMPRMFNLCAAAQGQAVRLALGLPGLDENLAREIMRDHLAKLCISWPGLLGLPPQRLPDNWMRGGMKLAEWIWGGGRPSDLLAWLASGRGVAPVLAAVSGLFAGGEAVADLPPLTSPADISAQENTPAGRVAFDGLMAQAEITFGRGPLWRALGRTIDLERCALQPLSGECPVAGLALVPAARGTYAVTASARDGVVTAFSRVTPTDHLLAAGGALEQSLASLPASKMHLAALVADILDPCVQVNLRELCDA